MSLKDWKSTVVECVERVMIDVFGSSTKDAVVYHLDAKGVGIRDAAERPDQFMKALHSLFDVGAEVLERQLVSEIGGAFGIASLGSRLRDIVEDVKSTE